MVATTNTAQPARVARTAVSMVFFLHGVVFANWAARIPDVQHKLGLSDQQLGFVLLGISFGVLTMLPFAGGFINRYGSRAMSVIGGMMHAASLLLLGFASNFWMLFAALFFHGGAGSLMDMAMNTSGVEVERVIHKRIMSSLHAMFSLGFSFGSLLGGWLVDLSVTDHFVRIAPLLILGNALCWFGLLPSKPAPSTAQSGAIFSLPPRPLWLAGLVIFAAIIGEGGAVDWSTKYMRDVIGAEAHIAAYALTAFSLCMMIGRFLGDTLAQRFTAATVVRWGGILGAAGLALLIGIPSVTTAVIGFGLVGFGVSTGIPLVFSTVGSLPNIASGTAIAGVATIGYAGLLAGPPLIGLVSQAFTLRGGLLVVFVLMLVLSVSAQALRPKAP